MFLNVCYAFFHKWARKWLVFIASVSFDRIFSIVWNRSSKSPIFSLLPSKCNVLVDTSFSIVAPCGCWCFTFAATASARRLMELLESDFWFFDVCSTIRKLILFDICVDRSWCWCDVHAMLELVTYTTFSLTLWPPSEFQTVNSWSEVPSLTVVFSCVMFIALPIRTPWMESSNWLRSPVLDCFSLRVKTMFVLTNQLYLKQWS